MEMNNLHKSTPDKMDFNGKEYKFILEPIKYLEVDIPKKSNTKFGSLAQLSCALRQLKYINSKIDFEDFLEKAKEWNIIFEENKYSPEELIILSQDVFSEDYSSMFLENNRVTNIIYNPEMDITDSRMKEIQEKVEEYLKRI